MDTEPVDPAVQAFEALRTEIAVLSSEIAAVLAEQRAIVARPAPDYDLTLGRIAKQLGELTARMAAVEAKPALAFTAERFGSALGAIMRQEAEWSRTTVHQAITGAKEQADVVGKAAIDDVLSRSAWWWRVAGGAVFGTMLGVMGCLGLVKVFPATAGGWIAATIVGQGPWNAGETLMEMADPVTFDKMVRLSNACRDNTVELCEATIAVRTNSP